MRDICFVDKSFDLSKCNLCHLSLQISLDGFSYSILDIPKGKYIVLKSKNFFLKRPRLLYMHVRDLILQDDYLNQKFKSIEILYSSLHFTLIPQAFYQNSFAERLFTFNNELGKGFSVEKTLFPKAETWCLFDMPDNLKEFLLLKFPKANLKNNFYPLVERSLKENKNTREKYIVHVNFFRDYFELVVISGSKLLLCNQFEYSGENDVLYFVLNVFDQLKLPPETTDLLLHGSIEPDSSLHQTFKKYIKKSGFAKPNVIFSYSYTFGEIPDHSFTTLLDLYKCE